MVYLLHYDTPLFHAQHYLGFAEDETRIEEHAKGTSRAHLPTAFFDKGVHFQRVRIWEKATRRDERRLKNQKNARLLCPICRQEKLHIKAAQRRALRAAQKQERQASLTTLSSPHSSAGTPSDSHDWSASV
jgi:hypothetical protein